MPPESSDNQAVTPPGHTTPVSTDMSPWAAVATRLESATAGEYEIFTELGRGGMAAVYLARDLALNRRVAIKVMAPGLLLGAGMMERFKREAVTVANLQHAHIVSIYGVRQVGDLHFFVMQFVPGRTLEGVIRDVGALPIPVVRAWLYQIGSALGYAHRRGVIHRDIKPGNILLNNDGEAIVTDFGIAKVAESPNQTQTGTVVGTPVYMSPEQCYSRELTGASDQYSLGVVAFEMLAGHPPFSGSSFGLMRSHTDTPPPPLHEIRPDIPVAMEMAVMRMLAKTPEERFASLADALVSLGATPLAPDDPLHATLQELAGAEKRLEQLADIIRTPASPVPKTRERPKQQPPPEPAEASAKVSLAAAATEQLSIPEAVRTPSAPNSRRVAWWTVPAAIAIGVVGYLALRPSPERAANPLPADPPLVAPAPTPVPNVTSSARNDSVSARDSLAAASRRDSVATAPVTPPSTVAATTSPPRRTDLRTPRTDTNSTRKPAPEPRLPATPTPNVIPTVTAPAPRPAARLDSSSTPAPLPPAPPKSEAELRAEIQSVILSYAHAIEQRDTSLIRRVFPNAGGELMTRWQGTFDDARGAISMSGGKIEILDTPRDVAGAQVQARATYTARFSSRAARSDQSFPVVFTAVVQRDGGTWHITGIR